MPIYEYRCDKCGTVSEILLLGRNEELLCGSCGSPDLIKLMSAPNINMGAPCSPAGFRPGGCTGSPDTCGNPGGCQGA